MAGTKLVHLREVSDCNWIFSREFLEGLNPLWKLSRDQGPANSLLRGYNLFNSCVCIPRVSKSIILTQVKENSFLKLSVFSYCSKLIHSCETKPRIVEANLPHVSLEWRPQPSLLRGPCHTHWPAPQKLVHLSALSQIKFGHNYKFYFFSYFLVFCGFRARSVWCLWDFFLCCILVFDIVTRRLWSCIFFSFTVCGVISLQVTVCDRYEIRCSKVVELWR